MLNCLQIQTGLIRKRVICIYGVDLARRGSEIITLGLGTVALITRDGALIASEPMEVRARLTCDGDVRELSLKLVRTRRYMIELLVR